jgi:cytochrome c oxidase accessory protein FixG
MCPWPRIQGAMLDENSLTVTYNDWRGEPRNRHAKKAIAEGKSVGDCVDCNACVVVCPMGIDIRDGQQLECITCALCIDACDDVMTRLGKERGLISYATLSDHQHNMALAMGSGKVVQPRRIRDEVTGALAAGIRSTTWRSILRPRTIAYFAVWCAIGAGMLVALSLRTPLAVSVLHDRNPLFVTMRDGSVSNGYDVKISNMTPQPRTVTVSIIGLDGARLSVAERQAHSDTAFQLALDPDKVVSVRAYVQVERESLPKGQARFAFGVMSEDGAIETRADATFEVPEER